VKVNEKKKGVRKVYNSTRERFCQFGQNFKLLVPELHSTQILANPIAPVIVFQSVLSNQFGQR
jgi:hypothetical protein